MSKKQTAPKTVPPDPKKAATQIAKHLIQEGADAIRALSKESATTAKGMPQLMMPVNIPTLDDRLRRVERGLCLALEAMHPDSNDHDEVGEALIELLHETQTELKDALLALPDEIRNRPAPDFEQWQAIEAAGGAR